MVFFPIIPAVVCLRQTPPTIPRAAIAATFYSHASLGAKVCAEGTNERGCATLPQCRRHWGLRPEPPPPAPTKQHRLISGGAKTVYLKSFLKGFCHLYIYKVASLVMAMSNTTNTTFPIASKIKGPYFPSSFMSSIDKPKTRISTK